MSGAPPVDLESPPALEIVVACDDELGIGRVGELPWRLPPDLRRFRRLTSTTSSDQHRNAVVMGRRTFESIPARFRPLPDRLNLILSHSISTPTTAEMMWSSSLDGAVSLANESGAERIFIGGGASVYREALAHPRLRAVHLTRIRGTFGCDTFFAFDPAQSPDWRRAWVGEQRTHAELDFQFELFVPIQTTSSQ